MKRPLDISEPAEPRMEQERPNKTKLSEALTMRMARRLIRTEIPDMGMLC